jgi:flagellar biosynthesis/type III secretory pathway protein FliH
LTEILDKRFTMAIQTDPELSARFKDPHFRMAMTLGVEKGLKKGREEGLKRGEEKGLKRGEEKGLKKGREEGLKKGLEKGLEKGREETASAMLTAGRYTRAEISKISGLSMHKLRLLAKGLKLSA